MPVSQEVGSVAVIALLEVQMYPDPASIEIEVEEVTTHFIMSVPPLPPEMAPTMSMVPVNGFSL